MMFVPNKVSLVPGEADAGEESPRQAARELAAHVGDNVLVGPGR